jgi:hypothetical protein
MLSIITSILKLDFLNVQFTFVTGKSILIYCCWLYYFRSSPTVLAL